MKTRISTVFTVVDGTASFDTGPVDTGEGKRDKNNVLQNGPHIADGAAVFTVDCTGFTGTSMDIEMFAVEDGVDRSLGSFAQLTGVAKLQLTVATLVPSQVKFVGTAVSLTDFDAVITVERLVP